MIDVRRIFRRLAICFSFSISALIICSSLCSIRSNSSLNAPIEVALVLPSAFGRSPESELPCIFLPDSCWHQRKTARAGSGRTLVVFLECHIINTACREVCCSQRRSYPEKSMCCDGNFRGFEFHCINDMLMFAAFEYRAGDNHTCC